MKDKIYKTDQLLSILEEMTTVLTTTKPVSKSTPPYFKNV